MLLGFKALLKRVGLFFELKFYIMWKYNIESLGFAQLGRPNFEEKENFELSFIMLALRKLLPKKQMIKKLLSFKIEENYHDFGTYKSIVLCMHSQGNRNDFDNAIRKIENADLSLLYDNCQQSYDALKACLDEEIFTVKQNFALSIDDVALLNGYNNFMDLIETELSDSVSSSFCPLSCKVEHDGQCQHGYDSIMSYLV